MKFSPAFLVLASAAAVALLTTSADAQVKVKESK